MKKLFVTFVLVGLAASSHAGVGNVYFTNIRTKTDAARIYAVDPSHPDALLQGKTADYTGRDLLYGAGYTAELWIGFDADHLQSLAGSQVVLSDKPAPKKTDLGGILYKGGLAKVNTTYAAGTKVVLQVRAWENRGGTIKTWNDVLSNDSVARGWSKAVLDYQLSGVIENPNGVPTPLPPAKNLVTAGLESFGLFVVPEPSVIALFALGLGALLMRRRCP